MRLSSLRQRALDVVRQVGGDTAQVRLEKRVANMDGFALLDWAESTVPGIGRALADWSQHGETDSLNEARMGTAALLTVLEELHSRTAEGGRASGL